MKRIDSVAHIGITVASLERSIAFYSENFGFRARRTNRFGADFFEVNRGLYRLSPSTTCQTALLEAPDGVQLELFQFSQAEPPQPTPWNRAGITHITLATDDVTALAARMRQTGVEFAMEVGVRPDGGHWLFVRDPDGNLVELMEPFREARLTPEAER